MSVLIASKRERAIQLLFAQWKVEKYKALGFEAWIHCGVLTRDKFEVFVMPRKRDGDYIPNVAAGRRRQI